MNEREFCYWLQGFFEVGNPNQVSPKQVQIIKDHLQLVFTKVTANHTTWVDGHGNTAHDVGYQCLHTTHSGVTAPGLC